jgi:hypothetical protein
MEPLHRGRPELARIASNHALPGLIRPFSYPLRIHSRPIRIGLADSQGMDDLRVILALLALLRALDLLRRP